MDEQKVQAVQPEAKPVEEPSKGGEKNIGMAVIAYFLFFVPLLTDSKNDPFVKFHVKQGLMLFLLGVAYSILRSFPYIGWILFWVYPIFTLALLALLILGVINAANGNTKELPLVGKFATQWFKF